MMQLRATKTFQSRYGFQRAGGTFWSEPRYAQDCIRNGLVEIVIDDDEPRPQRVQAFVHAPRTASAGKGAAIDPPLSRQPDQAAAKVDGPEPPSRSSRQAPRSRRPMPITAARDAK